MCRHLAHLGRPVSLGELLLEPEHGLLRQSWSPREQRHGTINADGFGIGWYDVSRGEPARYRRSVPMWGDPSLTSFAPVVWSRCVLAAVRTTFRNWDLPVRRQIFAGFRTAVDVPA